MPHRRKTWKGTASARGYRFLALVCLIVSVSIACHDQRAAKVPPPPPPATVKAPSVLLLSISADRNEVRPGERVALTAVCPTQPSFGWVGGVESIPSVLLPDCPSPQL